ncbi:hypothetical protein QMZ25_10620 [Stenotrophomonas sp. RS-48]|uniref:hypothetical protein n=1 Tax=Stenotrophomonas sp. RS-48 TaxID=3043300 RepID=UPI0024B4B745|nr:hypothetical protein [Stenotrophomonas sp. RS-48]MDI9249041.1 hypothetical protein [Stenotrophomonas sp. RS-48]
MAQVTIDIDLDGFDDAEILSECKARGLSSLPNAPAPIANADLVVERAYLACRSLPFLPQELKDMFWQIHGRAMT